MSGSGGGGGGGGTGSPSRIECSALIFRTTLNSPKPAVVRTLSKNDALNVEATGERGPVVVLSDGHEAGSITSERLLRLLECIAEGYTYVAIVLSVSGGKVDVEVRPRAD